MLTNHKEIKAWLNSMDIKNYTINDTGTVTVDGDVNINRKGLTEIPVQFRIVYGDFHCYYNRLKSLEGSPREVGGNFHCSHNNLKSLEGSPQEVGGNFRCGWNNLKSLEGAPHKVENSGDFDVLCNKFKPSPKCDTIINGELFWK